MKSKNIFLFNVVLIMLLALSACSNHLAQGNIATSPLQSYGQIYLYGEQHAVEKILEKELELWYEYYHKESMRHLFVELPYYTAELLNIWMKSDNDDILDDVYNDWVGTASYASCIKEFYKNIKIQCPETIFHGTDVGHQYNSTGTYFLGYLASNNLKDSEQYILAKEAIEQGKYYYSNSDDVYRENKMVENFIREFDKLNGESVMGIYGASHTGLDDKNFSGSVPCMANQLKERYKDKIHSVDLSKLAKAIEPSKVDNININGKAYKAYYYGKSDMTSFSKEYLHREFWCLENAYEDFKDKKKTGSVLPYNNYPMLVETGQVFVIDYTRVDGSIVRMYYRSDGNKWKDMLSTEEFKIEN